MPGKEDLEACSRWIDEHLSARLPVLDANSTDEDRRYFALVLAHMMHACSDGVNGCRDGSGRCTKGFDQTVCQPATTFDAKGFPVYKRGENDLRVCPHHRETLLDWNGHAYIEFAADGRSTLYLYKYLYKGAKKIRMQLTNADDVDDKDEINLYLRGRYLCSMDAMWRTLGYQTYPAPSPAVRCIDVKLPAQVEYFQNEAKLSDMLLYFHRPACLHHLTYSEFFTQYTEYTTRPARFTAADENIKYWALQIDRIPQIRYLCERERPGDSIVRMSMLYPNAGEIWYLRLILLKRPCSSFEDALTFNGVQYPLFQLSAQKHGYLEDENEADSCFREAIGFKSAPELRCLFAFMTMEGFPTLRIFDLYQDLMTEDFPPRAGRELSGAERQQLLLKDLQEQFSERGCSLSDFGLPEPVQAETELEKVRLRYPAAEQQVLLHQLHTSKPNNASQALAYATITAAVDHLDVAKSIFFMQGIGGAGKTTLAKKILAYARSKGLVAVGCASTGLAATIYEDFSTAHSLFCFPVIDEEDKDESEPAACDFEKHPEKLELLRAASVIVWDEMPSNHRELFEAAYRALDGFRGKIVLCMGDFRQIMPVLNHAVRGEVQAACISSSPWWSEFDIITLTINMRLESMKEDLRKQTMVLESTPAEQRTAVQQSELQALATQLANQTRYGEMILSVGEGKHDNADITVMNHCAPDGRTCYSMMDTIPHFVSEHPDSDTQALEFLYPNGISLEEVKKSAILAATNEQVDAWNQRVQELNPHVLHSLPSKDTFSEVDDPNGHLRRMISENVLGDYSVPGVPPHILNLKVGDVCLVLRNLSKRYGLANNSRVVVLSISDYCIRVQTLDENRFCVAIPRLRFKFKIPGGHSFEITRTQFPLRSVSNLFQL